MSDLAGFLLARVAEDEAVTKYVLSDYAEHQASWDCPCTGVVNLGDPGIEGLEPTGDGPLAEHIARWDPARVLAGCAAMRDLIEWALGIDHLVDVGDPAAPRDRLGDAVLRIVAQPYAGHPDYRPEWRP